MNIKVTALTVSRIYINSISLLKKHAHAHQKSLAADN